MLLLTLRGTPTLYYGDEIGLARVDIPRDRVTGSLEKSEPGLGFGRDPQRTPMQWDAISGAGFTAGEPWLPLSADHTARNVEALSANPGSILTLYRRLLALRRSTPALSVGGYRAIRNEGAALGFRRTGAQGEVAVLLNFGDAPLDWTLADGRAGHVLLSTMLDREGEPAGSVVRLRSNEGLIIRLTQ